MTEYDITLPKNREPAHAPHFSEHDIVVLALPVYGGRYISLVEEYISALRGTNTPCILVASYGNRHFDDALVEMEDLMRQKGFVVVGAAAVVGRHSFSGNIAGNRPTAEDLAGAEQFAQSIAGKELTALPLGRISGHRPYQKERMPANPLAPITSDDCTNCHLCAVNCPNGVINLENSRELAKDATACIMCHRCVVNCPMGAKHFEGAAYEALIARCEKNFGSNHCENLYIL